MDEIIIYNGNNDKFTLGTYMNNIKINIESSIIEKNINVNEFWTKIFNVYYNEYSIYQKIPHNFEMFIMPKEEIKEYNKDIKNKFILDLISFTYFTKYVNEKFDQSIRFIIWYNNYRIEIYKDFDDDNIIYETKGIYGKININNYDYLKDKLLLDKKVICYILKNIKEEALQ